LAIPGSDGRHVEVNVIGSEDDPPLMLCTPPDDASEKTLVVAFGALSELDSLISADVRVHRGRPVLIIYPRNVALEPGDEVDAAG
jgi:hypothetical protein